MSLDSTHTHTCFCLPKERTSTRDQILTNVEFPERQKRTTAAMEIKVNFGARKGTTKKLCDKDFAERSGELSGANCLRTLVLLGNDPVTPSNRSENSLVLFMRFFGFVSPFGSEKVIPRKYYFAFVMILIGQMIFRINVYTDNSPRILLSLSPS